MRVFRFAVLPIVATLAACGLDGAPNPLSGSGGPVSIGQITTARFGTVLVGTNGLTLYEKAGDSATSSTCTDSCLTSWPPVLVPSGQQAVGGPGVNGTFGTLDRSDSTLQATYEGKPLYYWQGDAHSGDVSGDGIDGFSVATP